MLCTFSAFNINFWAKINTFHSADEHLMLLLSSRKHRLNKDNYKREQNRNICQSVVSPIIHQFVFIFHVVQDIFEMLKVKAYLFICLLWNLVKLLDQLRGEVTQNQLSYSSFTLFMSY